MDETAALVWYVSSGLMHSKVTVMGFGRSEEQIQLFVISKLRTGESPR